MDFVSGMQLIQNVEYYHLVDKFRLRKIVVFMNMLVHGLKLEHALHLHVLHYQQYNNVNSIMRR